jgi:hypothetical protein
MRFDNLIMLVVFLVIVGAGGLLGGLIYYGMDTVQSVLETVNVTIPIQEVGSANGNLTTFQDIFGIVIYPFLELRDAIPYLTYFMVFAFIIALGISAYMSSKNPVFFVVHLLFTILLTYFAIVLSGIYVTLLSDTFINSLMVQFTIYNKLMLYLPQVIFFTSLIFGAIAFINIMKPQSGENSRGLNYGGDY